MNFQYLFYKSKYILYHNIAIELNIFKIQMKSYTNFFI